MARLCIRKIALKYSLWDDDPKVRPLASEATFAHFNHYSRDQ
jgi:hypothetical protein